MANTLLYIAPSQATFVISDRLLLEKEYKVLEQPLPWYRAALLPINLIRQFFWLLVHLPSANRTVVSFGGYWSLLPALLGKVFRVPTFIILHGTDVTAIEHLPYGSIRKPLVRWFCRNSYRSATKLLPVSESLVKGSNQFLNPQKPDHFGLRHYFPSVHTPVEVIHNGLDTEFWHPQGEKTKGRFVAVMSQDQWFLKGADLILSVADQFPTCSFHLVGLHPWPGLSSIPENVRFLGRLSLEQLRKEYQQAEFHFQLSAVEGFGLAVCEAMLCGCVPIVSSANILPQLAGQKGYVLTSRDQEKLLALIRLALKEYSQSNAEAAREHMINNFSLARRKEHLLHSLSEF